MTEDFQEATTIILRKNQLQRQALRESNLAFQYGRRRMLLDLLLAVLGGLLMSLAYPPVGWSWLAWVGLIPLYLLVRRAPPWRAALFGLVWGYAWSTASFFWLREIETFIPWAMGLVLGLFPAAWAVVVPGLRRHLLIPAGIQLKGFRVEYHFNAWPWSIELLFVAALAAWWVVLEWIRSWIATGLPWNLLATTQWQNIPLIQICEYTGVYGVSFILALVNFALAAAFTRTAIFTSSHPGRQFGALATVLLLTGAVVVFGYFMVTQNATFEGDTVTFSAAVIQGDISQRRQANADQAREAVDKYIHLSLEAAQHSPDLIIWPETATPYPLRGDSPPCKSFAAKFHQLMAETSIPYLIGSIDFESLPEGTKRQPGITNSALLFDRHGRLVDKFDKIHTVPFGEYIPLRRYLPRKVISMIDMGRDLTPGVRFEPLPVYPGVRAGVSICFEDVFPYIARKEAQLGANLLAVITNDAWYPVSSEPEQHLANSIFRTVETRLPMVRCGNNSASCLIDATGIIRDTIFHTKDESG
ncbi:MAG: apolipoprotein N-acyltransferase, partial [Victivallales bacterium]|nr:apolipoprotein N-acyltransferase [Victivallales bacterium]